MNDFVYRFILHRTFVDFTVSLIILPFYIVDFNSKMVKSTVKPLNYQYKMVKLTTKIVKSTDLVHFSLKPKHRIVATLTKILVFSFRNIFYFLELFS
jgi:predicted subunit of tRNA(5-methylaminomethyl-2-thiouridylate) methyltransferase